MAIVNGKILAPEAPVDAIARVIVRFKADTRLPYDADAEAAHANSHKSEWSALSKQFEGVGLMPALAPLTAAELARLEERLAVVLRRKSPSLESYFAITVPKPADAPATAMTVAAWPHVELAYVESGPVPPPLNPSDDPLSVKEGYLEAAPKGIDARWMWENNIDGSGASFVDLEQGWLLDHEDLPKPNVTQIAGLNFANFGHGAAVLGVLVAVDNSVGGIGIAPNATPRVVGQWFKVDANFFISTATAIAAALVKMAPGDILILETTAAMVPLFGWVPAETDPLVFNLIRIATDLGILVIQAAGNNVPHGSNLDAFRDANMKFILNRASPDFRDSGALMVGAATSVVPHERAFFSNFGSRIDCYAWGENVPTCGDGGLGLGTSTSSPQQTYTNFAGTSAATATVAGAALLMQSWRLKSFGAVYDPATLRALLSNPILNTQSKDPPNDRIGVMPNLRRLVEIGPISRTDDLWRLMIYILFGGIQDGGGLGFTPGGGPVPIGPLGPLVLVPEKRDVLLGLALTELAELASDDRTRRSIAALGIATMRGAVDRIAER